MKIKITICVNITDIIDKKEPFRRIIRLIADVFGLSTDAITVEEDTDEN